MYTYFTLKFSNIILEDLIIFFSIYNLFSISLRALPIELMRLKTYNKGMDVVRSANDP